MVSRRGHHPVFARCYGRLSRRMEPQIGPLRARLLAGLAGEVLEVGAGNGMNFAHYPTTVQRVLAVEPEPHLRDLARGEAERAPVPVEVVAGVAEELPAADDSVDAVVTTLVLCSVPDQSAALAEIARVLRPGGGLWFLEHVRAPNPGLRRLQRLLDATVWPALAGGCHTSRDTEAAVRAAGFTLTRLERLRFPDTALPVPTVPHLLGIATPAVRPPRP
jgi:ubiquinone/menaquinone biosynthesis C-methylase UbiE